MQGSHVQSEGIQLPVEATLPIPAPAGGLEGGRSHNPFSAVARCRSLPRLRETRTFEDTSSGSAGSLWMHAAAIYYRSMAS